MFQLTIQLYDMISYPHSLYDTITSLPMSYIHPIHIYIFTILPLHWLDDSISSVVSLMASNPPSMQSDYSHMHQCQ